MYYKYYQGKYVQTWLNYTHVDECCDLWECFVKMYFACFCWASRTASGLGSVTFNWASYLWPLLMTKQLSTHSGLCLLCHQEKGLWLISSTTGHGRIVLKHFWRLMGKTAFGNLIISFYRGLVQKKNNWRGHLIQTLFSKSTSTFQR